MKISILIAALAALSLTACEKTVTNNPPADTPAAVAVPVPVPGPAGPAGEPGKPGDTVVVAPADATVTPANPPADNATTPPPADNTTPVR